MKTPAGVTAGVSSLYEVVQLARGDLRGAG